MHNLKKIFEKVCGILKLNPVATVKKNRVPDLVFARWCFFYIAKKLYPNISLAKIAYVVNKTHCTAIYGINQINKTPYFNEKFNGFFPDLTIFENLDEEEIFIGKFKILSKNNISNKISELRVEFENSISLHAGNFLKYTAWLEQELIKERDKQGSENIEIIKTRLERLIQKRDSLIKKTNFESKTSIAILANLNKWNREIAELKQMLRFLIFTVTNNV